jgi:hypothetical protein
MRIIVSDRCEMANRQLKRIFDGPWRRIRQKGALLLQYLDPPFVAQFEAGRRY